MAENSKIEWTDHTFNPWIGCTKISPAYDNCYAESWAKRFHFAEWGGERRRTSKAKWREPIAWNRSALRSGIRRKVFCASLAGVFDNQVPDEWRTDLWGIIRQTTTLDWQLLTKRPQNIRKMLPSDWVTHAACLHWHHRGSDMPADWARQLRDHCAEAGAAFFMKQMARRAPILGDLLVRQFPSGMALPAAA